ncbi:YrzI family small protein [Neobacillus mesonae]|uniref:YrzI family small protein n=1 Tax=Neobacillus mesonae TaxID=1193713 RepID=A0A3Q9QUE1_9BACI|nr:YrzI family small protein [Neobacillus mesonae]AZU63430.1 YrzI family small protein [Neobacillus mesonae]MED4203261.1 YrzI family small protein [Neobacillus mesonae]
MTLNILFFSITIKKRKINLQEAVNQEKADKLYEQNRDRQMTIHHFM